MDTVLRGKKPSEIIPVNLTDSVFYYPVRHHSPVCAWHLQKVIRQYQPRCILVEGPENANDLVSVLTHPDTHPPIALYYSCRDGEGKLDPEGKEQSYRCYYPFLDCSPELVALRSAAELGIPAKFMDLSYGQILMSTARQRGLRSEAERHSYASDRYLAHNAFLKLLCEKARVRDFDEFWESYFECDGMSLSTEEFISRMHTYCLLARENTPREELLEDGCIAREAHMAKRIRQAVSEFGKVLVVAGGFHIYGLLHSEDVPAAAAVKNQSVYPMRYSMDAADALSGYASGMPSPAFYHDLWNRLETCGPTAAWEDTLLDYLVRCGRKLRQDGHTISAYDETCALEQARGLASLRGKSSPGLFELQDAVLSCFVKGEASLSGLEPMRVLRKLTTGKTVGSLCKEAPVPPLVQDFAENCRKFRLRTDAVFRQETALSIFSDAKHRELSFFFHRTVFLECGFAKCKKGPDLVGRKDRNLVREIWEYRWNASVDSRLIEHAVSGGTVEDACITELRDRMYTASNASQAAKLMVQGFQMGLGDVADALSHRMNELLVSDGDFSSLCDACVYLNDLRQWQDAYGLRGDDRYDQLLGRCFLRVIQMIPSMHTVDDRSVEKVQRACMMIYQITEKETFQVYREKLLIAFASLVGQNPIHAALHGTVLGLLYGADPVWKKKIDVVLRGYLRGTQGMMLRSAAFLRGLFYSARDLLLVDPEFLVLIDQLLCELDDSDFTSLLPELRLAFSYFRPMETDRIARRASAFHGGKENTMNRQAVDPRAYSMAEALDAWVTSRLDRICGREESDEDL